MGVPYSRPSSISRVDLSSCREKITLSLPQKSKALPFLSDWRSNGSRWSDRPWSPTPCFQSCAAAGGDWLLSLLVPALSPAQTHAHLPGLGDQRWEALDETTPGCGWGDGATLSYSGFTSGSGQGAGPQEGRGTVGSSCKVAPAPCHRASVPAGRPRDSPSAGWRGRRISGGGSSSG